MNNLVKILFIVFLLFTKSVRSQEADETPNKQKARPQKSVCHQTLMQSYLLKGVEFSTNRTMILCPSIKNNCCTRHDQQRIFHFSRDILPPKMAEYNQKVDVMLYQIRMMNNELIKTTPKFTGSLDRRRFCGTQYRQILNFDFQALYDSLTDEIKDSQEMLEMHNRKFFCLMCDGKAHSFFTLRQNRQTVAFDINYCKEMLKETKTLNILMNVELTKYFVSVQNVVDCLHYSNSFDLKFPNPKKIEDIATIKSCYEEIEGPRFKNACAQTCEKIQFAKIITMFQGDFDFLHDIVTIFNRFIAYRESGNLISMRLRHFFSRFRIPRRMTKTARTNFLQNLVLRTPKIRKTKKYERPKRIYKEEMKLSQQKNIVSSRKLLDQSFVSNKSKIMADTKIPPLVHQIKKSKHHQAQTKDTQVIAASDDLNLPEQMTLKQGRFLQYDESGHTSLRTSKKVKKFKEVTEALPYFDKTLYEFYHEIELPKVSDLQPNIYIIRQKPIPFDNLEKSWLENDGINYHNYINIRFEMSQAAFYRLLYIYQKPEMPDSKLTMFLMDFNSVFFKSVESTLNMDTYILPSNFESKFLSQLQIDDDFRRRKLRLKSVERRKLKQGIKTKKLKKK